MTGGGHGRGGVRGGSGNAAVISGWRGMRGGVGVCVYRGRGSPGTATASIWPTSPSPATTRVPMRAAAMARRRGPGIFMLFTQLGAVGGALCARAPRVGRWWLFTAHGLSREGAGVGVGSGVGAAGLRPRRARVRRFACMPAQQRCRVGLVLGRTAADGCSSTLDGPKTRTCKHRQAAFGISIENRTYKSS